jgi:hypothetical protein
LSDGLAGPVALLDMFRANCDFIVNGLDFQGNADVARLFVKISSQ